jgi:DNA-binding NtrC family response regulator
LSTRNIAFVYLSANSNKQILEEAKTTRPYGFLVKPFRQKDVLVMLDIAWYLHKQKLESAKGNIVSASPQDQIKIGEAFSKIVAQSRIMQNVFEHARIVGSSDTPVLILGENGTGKERIAHCIHQISARSAQPFIVINCGALPASLIESELFGHEKGTFTGATEKRIGKFQQAEGGTIFLDEVGELPP